MFCRGILIIKRKWPKSSCPLIWAHCGGGDLVLYHREATFTKPSGKLCKTSTFPLRAWCVKQFQLLSNRTTLWCGSVSTWKIMYGALRDGTWHLTTSPKCKKRKKSSPSIKQKRTMHNKCTLHQAYPLQYSRATVFHLMSIWTSFI